MRLAVALSGGGDSLLALALLKEAGRDVVAVHGRFLALDPARAALERDLARICRGLGVDFEVLDLVREFEQRVVARFAAQYAAGLTPNPCLACNREIKFGAFMDLAASRLGARGLASGHFASLGPGPDGRPLLARGRDASRDQSYFLCLAPRERLARAVFPLARRSKAEVSAGLGPRGLAPPLAAASREICFVPGDDYRAFLLARGMDLPGPGRVVLRDGTRVGGHRGLWRHTQGQRRGLGIAHAEPLYVLDKDPALNTLVVGTRAEMLCRGCLAREVNIMLDPGLWPAEVLVQTRYRQKALPARVRVRGPDLEVEYLEPRPRPAPGQAVAVYSRKGEVLAGAVIARITE
ncbi:MAG: tRNA 2-thiouridine(34) synthase MnmA, partial [Desulfovibrionaceae bacterium]|nr:tRNA 2-thiouridine(34) synthase MnmA [Desulfovibrionaceae bacterium]